jgi:hypothetical protein
MHPRGLSPALFLATIVLIVGLLAGCGGGDQAGSGSQQAGGKKAKQEQTAPEKQEQNKPEKQDGNAPKQKAKNEPAKKILFGLVKFVNPKTEGFSVKPTIKKQGKKPVAFRLAQQTRITLGGKEAKLEDMKKGQQAQVEYVVRNDRNRARVVRLFEGGGETQDGKGGEENN